MPSGSFNQVNFSDGEGLVYSDLTGLQSYMQATFLDQVLGATGRFQEGDPYATTGSLYAIGAGGAALPSTSSLSVTNLPGMVFMYSSSFAAPDGLTPRLLGYQLSQNELFTTTAAPNTTQPRYDLVAVRLYVSASGPQTRDFQDASTGVLTTQASNKVNTVFLEKLLVTGSAAASAGLPACPAGFVPWAYCLVTASLASYVFNDHAVPTVNNGVLDARFPFGMKAYYVPAHQFFYISGSTGLFLTPNGALKNTSGGASRDAYASVPCGHRTARLVGIQLWSTSTGELMQANLSGSDIAYSALKNIASLGYTVQSNGYVGLLTGSGTPTTAIDYPIWCHGKTSYGTGSLAFNNTTFTQLVLKVSEVDTFAIRGVHFFIAGA